MTEKDRKIISLGVGVQSTYIVLASCKEFAIEPIYSEWKDAVIIFADTGAEKQETLNYFKNILEPIMKRNHREYYVVKSKHYPIYNYYYSRKIIPTRRFRHCTDIFKIRPIKKKIKQIFENVNFKNPVYQALGITSDENHRMKASDVKYIINQFPIIHLTRDEIIHQYKMWNLPTPVKSGCWFCPYNRIQDLELLNHNQWEKIETLENNCSKPNMYLFYNKPISYWKNRFDHQKV